MPNIHLTDSEVTYLYSLLDGVMSRHGFGLDDQRYESNDDEISALFDKLEPYHFNAGDKHCLNCSNVITSPNPRKTTCSDSCRQAWSRRMKRAKATA